jgi:hypothetical protein
MEIGVVIGKDCPIPRREHCLGLWTAQGRRGIEDNRFNVGKAVDHGEGQKLVEFRWVVDMLIVDCPLGPTLTLS